jgi:hypothetical protein
MFPPSRCELFPRAVPRDLPQTDDLPPDAAHTQPDHEVDEANDEAVSPPGPKRDVPGVVVNRKKVPDTSREITA